MNKIIIGLCAFWVQLSLSSTEPSKLIHIRSNPPYIFQFLHHEPYQEIKVTQGQDEVAQIHYQAPADSVPTIDFLYVMPNHRNKGIASTLLKEAREHIWALKGDNKEIYFDAMCLEKEVPISNLIAYYQNRGASLRPVLKPIDGVVAMVFSGCRPKQF